MRAAQNEDKRSQVILRVPRDRTPAQLTLADGERDDVLLFVPPGQPVARVLAEQAAFVPVAYPSGLRLVQRAAIASISIEAMLAVVEDLPVERQKVRVHLTTGSCIDGELRWIAGPDSRRTLDCFNDPMPHVAVHDATTVHYIAKPHITSVEEL